jgi:hypothetical protein
MSSALASYLSVSETGISSGDFAVRNLRANQKRQKTKTSKVARFKGDGEGGLKRASLVCKTVGPEARRGRPDFCSSRSISSRTGSFVGIGTQSLDMVIIVVVRRAQPLEWISHSPHGPLQGIQENKRQSKILFVDELLLQNRWILVEFLPLPYPNQQSAALDSKQIYAAVKQSVIVNFGDTGWGAVGSSLNGTPLVYAGSKGR